MTNENSSAELLRSVALRATPGRVRLLDVLKNAHGPQTVEEVHSGVGEIDLVTVYRTLEHLLRKKLVREVHFKNAPVRYELQTHGHHHHHHVVCTHCGRIDELPECDIKAIEKEVLKSTSFANIDEHTLEFFGTCRLCARTV